MLQKEQIINCLQQPFGNISVLAGAVYVPKEYSLTTYPYGRFLLCLEDPAQFTIFTEHGPSLVKIKCGEILYVAADQYIYPTDSQTYKLFEVHLSEASIDLFYEDHAHKENNSNNSFASDSLYKWEIARLFESIEIFPDEQEKLQLYFKLIYYNLNKLVEQHCQESTVGKSTVTFQTLVSYVCSYYNKTFTREDMAALVDIHPNHVSYLFRKHTGGNFKEYLQILRLEVARCLLPQKLKLAVIAKKCAFNDAAYMSNQFRKVYGKTPGKIRKMYKEGLIRSADYHYTEGYEICLAQKGMSKDNASEEIAATMAVNLQNGNIRLLHICAGREKEIALLKPLERRLLHLAKGTHLKVADREEYFNIEHAKNLVLI